MRKIKLLSLLAILMAALALLVACGDREGEDGEPSVGEAISIDLSEYSIVRPAKASQYCSDAATQMYSSLMKAKVKLTVSDDWLANGESADGKKEILIGDTNRPESTEVKNALGADNYRICIAGGKITIVAQKDAYLAEAVEYFAKNIFKGEATLNVEEGFVYSGQSQNVAEIVADKKTEYTVVRTPYDTNREHISNATGAICNTVYNKTGAFMTVENEGVGEADNEDKEILVGRTNRKESAEALALCKPNQYIIAFIGNKIAIHSPSTEGLIAALDKFCDVISECGDKSGLAVHKENIIGEIGASAVGGVPEPQGLDLVSSYVGRGDIFETVWEASSADYDKYCQSLVSAGYARRDSREINGNRFASYTKGGKFQISVSFLPYDKTLRIISESYTYLPPLTDNSYTKVMDTTLTQFCLGADNIDGDKQRNFGMSYVFQLADGSYLCIDGGGDWGDDYIDMYNYMDTNKKGDKIVIAAWLFTHDHWDHVMGFIKFFNQYSSNITLQSIGHNFVKSNLIEGTTYSDNLLSAVAKKAPNCKVFTLHAGQQFAVRDVKLDVLYTHELLAPYYVPDMNETSTVFRVTVGNKKILFLGDISTIKGHQMLASEIIFNMYGSTLKSDIVQVAHHGWNGATEKLYDTILPDIALWPVHADDWNYVKNQVTSKHLLQMINSGRIGECYISKDGTVTLTFTSSGINVYKHT